MLSWARVCGMMCEGMTRCLTLCLRRICSFPNMLKAGWRGGGIHHNIALWPIGNTLDVLTCGLKLCLWIARECDFLCPCVLWCESTVASWNTNGSYHSTNLTHAHTHTHTVAVLFQHCCLPAPCCFSPHTLGFTLLLPWGPEEVTGGEPWAKSPIFSAPFFFSTAATCCL